MHTSALQLSEAHPFHGVVSRGKLTALAQCVEGVLVSIGLQVSLTEQVHGLGVGRTLDQQKLQQFDGLMVNQERKDNVRPVFER